MYFKITMFWIMLNIFLMISAISQVRGLNQNSSNISKKTKNEPSFLILKDTQGNMYKYIYPNDMDQFSKMSSLGNKNSSTVIHLPPGILKTENSSCKTDVNYADHPNIRISSTTSERPRTTYSKNTTNSRSILSSKYNPIVSLVLTTPRNVKKDYTTVSIKENKPTENINVKNSNIKPKTEKEKDGKDAGNGMDSKSKSINIPHDNNIEENPINTNNKYENLNEQQNLYKSCNTRYCLILLVENDIKLKLFSNSNGILNKSSPVNSRQNSAIQLKDELSTEDDIMYED